MIHLKRINETITKKFTDWAKNPQKPKMDKFRYLFSVALGSTAELIDNGDFSTYDLLKFIEEYHHQNIFDSIARTCDVNKYVLDKDSEKLDDCFEQWAKEEYGERYWPKFLKDYFEGLEDEYNFNSRNYDDLVNSIEIENYEMSESWFKVYETKLLNSYSAPDYDALYVEVTCSSELEDFNYEGLRSFVKDQLVDNINYEVKDTFKRLRSDIRFYFYIRGVGDAVLVEKGYVKTK